MFTLNRNEDGKVCSIQVENMSIPVHPDNVNFQEWREQNPDVDITTIVEPPGPDYGEKRLQEYGKNKIDERTMLVALWEHVIEGRPASAEAIQAIREVVKQQIPKE